MQPQYKHFGRYLYSLRTRQGFESIADYIEHLKESSGSLPLSENYYRDVEAGRKLPTIEKAYELFRHLPFAESDDKHEFFWQYLKEVLPPDVFNEVVKPRVDTTFETLRESQELLAYDLKLHREAAAYARFAESHVSTDAAIAVMNEQFDLMPIVHFVHMVERATLDDLRKVCEKNGISVDDDDLDTFLRAIGVSITDEGGKKIYRRSKPVYRIPKTEAGTRFKDRFTEDEVMRSLCSDKRTAEIFEPDSTFDFSVIVALSKQAQAKLTDRLRDLISEVSVSSKQLDDPTAAPFFVGVVVSGRPAYRP